MFKSPLVARKSPSRAATARRPRPRPKGTTTPPGSPATAARLSPSAATTTPQRRQQCRRQPRGQPHRHRDRPQRPLPPTWGNCGYAEPTCVAGRLLTLPAACGAPIRTCAKMIDPGAVNLAGTQRDPGVQGLAGLGVGGLGQAAAVSPVSLGIRCARGTNVVIGRWVPSAATDERR